MPRKSSKAREVVEKVVEMLNSKPSETWAPVKERHRVQGRSLLSYWAARELGITLDELSRKLRIFPAAVTLSVKGGEKLGFDNDYSLI